MLFLTKNLYTIQATNGPTIPIENTLAPKVVKPPWASNKAWKSKTIVANTAAAAGPKIAALNPLPVGCEQLPVTEGSFKEDKTNMNAPLTANNAVDSGVSSRVFFIW